MPLRGQKPQCDLSHPCAEWISLGRGSARALVYTSHPLASKNPSVRRAVVVVHGTTRDARAEYQTIVLAARRAGVADDTLIVAPRFASHNATCGDVLAAGEVNWPCEGNSWRAGGMSSDRAYSSFDFADEILRRLARNDRFPALKAIVLAGHSAGGQFVTRYEMSNQVHDVLGVPVSYVVANPSSYAYPDERRPGPVSACRMYNMWPYGLEDRAGYSAREPVAQLVKQLVSRPTTYLLGEKDVLRNSSFDASCAAMAQGPTRLARGRAFAAAVANRFGAHHAVVTVPGCGHDPACMFTADAARPVLFPAIQ